MDNIKEMAYDIVGLIDEKLGTDIVLMEVSGVSSLADYFIIASGNNSRQIAAIIENIEAGMEKKGYFVKNKEGNRECNWMLVDYGDIIVHVFNKDERDFYNLEKLWCDAKITKFDVDTKINRI